MLVPESLERARAGPGDGCSRPRSQATRDRLVAAVARDAEEPIVEDRPGRRRPASKRSRSSSTPRDGPPAGNNARRNTRRPRRARRRRRPRRAERAASAGDGRATRCATQASTRRTRGRDTTTTPSEPMPLARRRGSRASCSRSSARPDARRTATPTTDGGPSDEQRPEQREPARVEHDRRRRARSTSAAQEPRENVK